MKFKPSVMAVDFETADSEGASVDFWREDFRAISCAFSWIGEKGEIKRTFHEGEEAIAKRLRKLAADEIPLVAHNLQYDFGVMQTRFPWFPRHLLKYDTQRMVQTFDNGGAEAHSFDEKNVSIEDQLAWMDGSLEYKTGLGLESASSRILPSVWHGHKQRFYAYLRQTHGVLLGKEGQNLHLLPPDQLEAYNTADTDVTLMLFRVLSERFEQLGYDWRLDHALHLGAIQRLVNLKIDGVKVDSSILKSFVEKSTQEMVDIKHRFLTHYAEPIAALEAKRLEAWVGSPKTQAGRDKRLARKDEAKDEWTFNPGSTKQLAELFVGELGMKPTFWTKESKARRAKAKTGAEQKPFIANPSFRAVHLKSYGDGGKILEKLKKRQIVSKQAENLILLAETDGRWHVELRACGTKTNRYAGGGNGKVRLNVQALGRREAGLMTALIPDTPDHCFVSIDLSAGEPTVTAHYSQDANYFAACFGMVGKAPFFDRQGILQIDDIYIMGASVAPTGKQIIFDAFNATYDGMTFAERWLADSLLPDDQKVIRNVLKATRAFHKTAILALQYGQRPNGMVMNAYDNGFTLSQADAQGFWRAFWYQLFPNVRMLSERLQATFKRRGYLVNEFGYRLVPERESLCLNYQIQSSVSGIMKVFEQKLFAVAPYAQYKSTIHDESICQIQTSRLEDFRQDVERATVSLNEDLKWSVNIRTGFAPGKNLYEAK